MITTPLTFGAYMYCKITTIVMQCRCTNSRAL